MKTYRRRRTLRKGSLLWQAREFAIAAAELGAVVLGVVGILALLFGVLILISL